MSKSHNKKRNTAFLYEALILELTKATIKNDPAYRSAISVILKKHFNKNSILARELDCYRALTEERVIDPYTFEKIIIEAKRTYANLDLNAVFVAQSALIADMNQSLNKDVYSNFVPNYKHLATISKILHPRTPVARRVLFEKKLLDASAVIVEVQPLQPINTLVYKTFVKKFNEAYDSKLLDEQKVLLRHYISSLADGQIQLKLYINEELGRLQAELNQVLRESQIKENPEVKVKIQEVTALIEGDLSKREINAEYVLDVLKIQQLAADVKHLLTV